MAFIIEDARTVLDKDSKLVETGFVISDEKLAGTSGVIHSVSKNRQGFNAGDHVIFSKFNAEQIDLKAEDIPRGRLRAVPTDSILGWIS